MRLSALSIFIAVAGYVTASPLRVIVVSHQEISTGQVIRPTAPLHEVGLVTPIPVQHDCGSLRNKAFSFSNSLRAKLGLPPIKPNYIDITVLNATADAEPPRGMRMLPPLPHTHDAVEWRNPIRIMPVGHDDHQRMMWRHHHGSFLKRVHHALMTLGPWEGRAVAFVLGCGIGVLLRMIWVMTIVTARLITGRRSGEDEIEAELVFETDAEEVLVPPPQYTDEKAELVEADKKAATV